MRPRLDMNPKRLLKEFDHFLSKRNLKFEGVLIGASALYLLEVIKRETIDIDILSPDIPVEILKAAEEFRRLKAEQDVKLIEKWFNNGPSSLRDYLLTGWQSRTQAVFQGKSLTIHALSRKDLIATKLLAFCDRDERDLEDLRHLNPSREDLLELEPWVAGYDGNPGWSKHVRGKFENLARLLGYEL
jgi:hypothetical protein